MTTPAGNVVTDSTATWATRVWAGTDKIDDGAAVAEADLDEFAGAVWANGVCEALADINSAMNGATNVPAWTLAGPLTINGQSAPGNPASNAVALYSDAGVLKWKDSAGTVYDLSSTGGGVTMFMSDAPPVSPASTDDYFPGTTLNARWTEWDDAGDSAITVHNGYCRVTKTADAAPDSFSGMYQAAPASGTYTVVAKIGLQGGIFTDGDRAGLALFDDATNSASPFTCAFINSDSTSASQVAGDIDFIWSTYTSFGGSGGVTHWSTSNINTNVLYIRFRVAAAVVHLDISWDGVSWLFCRRETLAWTPSHVGVAVQQLAVQTNMDGDPACIVYWFRVIDGATGLAQDTIGDEMSLARA